MKKIIISACIATIAILFSCKKDATSQQYSSLAALYASLQPKTTIYDVNGATGGSFTTSQGTTVTVPAQAFVTKAGNPVTGTVNIEFLDIYKKGDMLLRDKPTVTYNWNLLRSGGEFFIRAKANNAAVEIAPGKSITIEQPIANGDSIGGMAAFILPNDTPRWINNDSDFVTPGPSSYVYSMYSFQSPVDSGSWCNSDNAAYFSGFPQTSLQINQTDFASFSHTDVFLFFKNKKSMVHVYSNGTNYPYNYAPLGFDATLVAVSVKDGDVYSATTDFTITNNSTVSFTLSKTTNDNFKTLITALR
ncbi:MAG: hypothetical protein U0T84_06480 [Chitinophagales bacterium]